MAAGPHRLGLTPRRVPRTLHPDRLVALGPRAGHGGQPDDQPPAPAARPRRAWRWWSPTAASAAPWARAFKYYLYLALIVIAIRVVFRSVFGGDIDADADARAVPAAPDPSAVLGRRRAARWTRHSRRDASAPSTTACGSGPCCAASARPTPWPTRSGPCGCSPGPSTSWAWPSWSPSAWRLSWSRACSGFAGPAGFGGAPVVVATPCERSPSPCSRTPSSGPCGSPRPWTLAATAGPGGPRPGLAERPAHS